MPDFTPKKSEDEKRSGADSTLTFDKEVCHCATCGHTTMQECEINRWVDRTDGVLDKWSDLKPDTRDPTSNCRCCVGDSRIICRRRYLYDDSGRSYY